MIIVYARIVVKPDQVDTFKTIANSLATASRQDNGCISYHVGKVTGENNTFAFIEQWQSQSDVNVHYKQPHFTQAVAQFENVLSQPLEISVVTLL